jgi:chromate transporter
VSAAPPSIADVAGYFVRLGATGFGGPAALTSRMRADLVDRGWVTADEFELGVAIAASCPGPLAYQIAVYCGYVRHGIAGAVAVGLAFAAAPFLIVVGAAAAYTHWSGTVAARGLFFGAAPAVTVLIARASLTLTRTTLHRAPLAWATAACAAVLTWGTGQEPLWLFAAAAALGAIGLRPVSPSTPPIAATPDIRPAAMPLLLPAAAAATAAAGPAALFAFFFKVGCLVFGSGLVIVPFLRASVVDEYQWITAGEFLDSVTIGLVSPGPVVITATFVGYLVAGVGGAGAATAGMFLPAILFTVVAAPWFARHRRHPVLAGAVRGITAAVVGALAGTVPLVGASAIASGGAGIVAALALWLAWRRVPDPLLVAISGAAGLALTLAA